MSSRNPVNGKPSRPLKMGIEQIKQIYDYTKFHIGLYFTLLAGLIALVNFSGRDHSVEPHRTALVTIIFVLLIGGVAGALVASRIVYGPWGPDSFVIEDSWFWRKRPSTKAFSRFFWSWADVALVFEHYAFWTALGIALLAFTR